MLGKVDELSMVLSMWRIEYLSEEWTYGSERLEHEVVQPIGNSPESRPVEVEGEIVVELLVNLREEGRDRHAGPQDEPRPILCVQNRAVWKTVTL